MTNEQQPEMNRHEPAERVSAWYFLALLVITAVVISAGVFEMDSLMRVIRWLALVL